MEDGGGVQKAPLTALYNPSHPPTSSHLTVLTIARSILTRLYMSCRIPTLWAL